MNYTPHQVNTDNHFYNFAEGLPQGNEKECTARVFCLAAKRYGSWSLSQDELDAVDSKGSFRFNGLEDWFDFESGKAHGTTRPNNKFFGRLIMLGLVKDD